MCRLSLSVGLAIVFTFCVSAGASENILAPDISFTPIPPPSHSLSNGQDETLPVNEQTGRQIKEFFWFQCGPGYRFDSDSFNCIHDDKDDPDNPNRSVA